MDSVKQLFDLTDRVAIITGGAGLLGEKHAEAVAEFGGNPILLDVDQKGGLEKAKRVAHQYKVRCEFVYCDISDEASVCEARDSLMRTVGRIDILINNAAIDAKVGKDTGKNLSRLENFRIDQWNKEVAVGLTGSMLCSKIFGSEMAERGKGVILNISSDLGIIAPDQRLYKQSGLRDNQQPAKPITYSVIKHGLIGMTKYLATYWGDNGIRCNTLCPGGVYTNQPEEFVKKISQLIPLGRMADINEYKAVVAFLVSDASTYMTGATIVMDGGRTIW